MESDATSPRSDAADEVQKMSLGGSGAEEPVAEEPVAVASSHDECLAKEGDPGALGVSYSMLGSPVKEMLYFKAGTTLKQVYECVLSVHGKSTRDLSLTLANNPVLEDDPEMSKTLEELKVEPETNVAFVAKAAGGKKKCSLS